MSLKNILVKKGIKQIELAKKLNISRQNLRYKLKAWEEKRKGFSIDELDVIAKILNETLNFFYNICTKSIKSN
ncbi:MAG: helix-turn-helix domain-containing protein [Clostridium sp.]